MRPSSIPKKPAGVAIRNARLFEALARSQEATVQQAEVERRCARSPPITAVRDPRRSSTIAAEAARLLGHERVFINLLNDPTGRPG
jgi:hypothetical protein